MSGDAITRNRWQRPREWVWAYVKDVLDRILSGSTDYAALLPWNWAASHPEAIRTYRQEERRDRSHRKTERRQARRNASA